MLGPAFADLPVEQLSAGNCQVTERRRSVALDREFLMEPHSSRHRGERRLPTDERAWRKSDLPNYHRIGDRYSQPPTFV
jgi:hypothetical protein